MGPPPTFGSLIWSLGMALRRHTCEVAGPLPRVPHHRSMAGDGNRSGGLARRTGAAVPPPDRWRSERQRRPQARDKAFRMGVLSRRSDGRYDMPDLFRVAARLLRKGGVAPI